MKPIVLCIMDGVGISESTVGNAYKLSNTPTLDMLFDKFNSSKLGASGMDVGLPYGQMGNSEVGHSSIGTGRINYQPIARINKEITDGIFFENKVILEMFDYIKSSGKKLHLMGLVSDGGVHSSMGHISALISMCVSNGVDYYIHIFTDGRDTLQRSSMEYISLISDKSKISTVSGRYYAMDRDNRYDRVKKCYDVLTGVSDICYDSIEEAIKINYDNDITDEFIEPGIINRDGIICEDDGIIFFNFRPDRVRELGASLTDSDFNGFERDVLVKTKMLTLMPVSDEVKSNSIYELEIINDTFGEILANNGLKQLRIAETEKYAHVTYFFDGGRELQLDKCDRILVDSPKVATYDLQPEMSAFEITSKLINVLGDYDIVILNYANGDMVGHTGDMNACISSVEAMDECLSILYSKILELDGTLILTADHGNCEQLLDDAGNVLTSHTTNLVPFLITGDYEVEDGRLCDIAPTILHMLDIEIPESMSRDCLIK